jgi:hypothetical protein
VDDTFLLLLNASEDGVTFRLPAHVPEVQWERVLDTAESDWDRPSLLKGDRYRLRSRALALLRTRRRGGPPPSLLGAA